MTTTPMRRCGNGRGCTYPECDCAAAVAVINTRNLQTLRRVEAGVNVLCAVVIGVALGLLIVFELGGWPLILAALKGGQP